MVLDEARSLFESSGLGFPPVPRALAGRVRKVGDWCYSTEETPNPYAFWEALHAADDPSTPDSFTLAHAGHGVNSYAIILHVVLGKLRVLLQYSWGGVYMDNDKAAARTASAFARLTDAWPVLEARFASRQELHVLGWADRYQRHVEVVGTWGAHHDTGTFDLDAALVRLAGDDEPHVRIRRPDLCAPAAEWLVYGDALQDVGDPRGALIGLAHEAAEGRADREHSAEYVLSHAEAMLGRAARYLNRYALELQYCEVVGARVTLRPDDDPTAVVHALLDAPCTRHLRALEVRGSAGRLEQDAVISGRCRRGMKASLL